MSKPVSFFVGIIAVGLLGVFFAITSAPAGFPVNKQITITEGATSSQIADLLQTEKVIKSAALFRFLLRVGGGERGVQAGDYWFGEPLFSWRVIGRLVRGQFVLQPVKLTILEGSSVAQIEKAIFDKLPALLGSKVGNLGEIFPDTYFVPPQISFDKLMEMARRNFMRQTASLRAKTLLTGRTWNDIVVMASIIEEEASDESDRRMIAGVLWKRLDIGMPLQVDVAPETYKRVGLPDQAIVNPGLDAIDAAVHPTESEFWYYLADETGKTHYAATFDEHKENKIKYLK
ncbi:endolytic transglycosylase MltG [Candidatus Nomurabacteria bacterium]|nr:endolytic transglycosylase MltG [Candidatus Nomurabacteria bacterium]